MENSHIEWTTHTFNPWWGCMKVSEGCKNCYAETLDNRYHHADPHWGPNSPRKQMSDKHWMQPFIWDEKAHKAGVKAKVFCASMADVFEGSSDPVVIEGRKRLFNIIDNTPNLIWQLLTKRPENILASVPEHWREGFPENVWMGTSVENQAVYKERVKALLLVPAVIHFLSCEPLLGHIDLKDEFWKFYPKKPNESGGWAVCKHNYYGIGVDWVIAGGESGNASRPVQKEWIESLRDQCNSEQIPFFFKQWGGRDKKASGALLDEVEYKQFPKI